MRIMSEGNRPVIIPYTSEDGSIKLDVKLDGETVWLTQEEMASLFGVGRTAITKHIGNIYDAGELNPATTSAKMAQLVENRPGYMVTIYNLEMVIAVGYRVNSAVAIKFRQWATVLIKEYLVKRLCYG